MGIRYEVTIQVKRLGTSSDTMRSLRQTWEFGDDQQWWLSGEAYVVEETASDLSKSIRAELEGSDKYNLNESSGNPRKA